MERQQAEEGGGGGGGGGGGTAGSCVYNEKAFDNLPKRTEGETGPTGFRKANRHHLQLHGEGGGGGGGGGDSSIGSLNVKPPAKIEGGASRERGVTGGGDRGRKGRLKRRAQAFPPRSYWGAVPLPVALRRD